MTFLKVKEIIQRIIKMCNEFQVKEVILYGSRAKGIARERGDIDIAVSGSPREVLREAFKANLISDEAWMDMFNFYCDFLLT